MVGGASLSRAMAAHPQAFPQDMVDIMRAGEATGTLVDVLASLTGSIERRDAVRRHLVSAMTYPGLLVLMAIGTVAMIVGVLVPALAPLFEGTGQQPPFAIRTAAALGAPVDAEGVLPGRRCPHLRDDCLQRRRHLGEGRQGSAVLVRQHECDQA
ncbi:hypothetical protein GCM10007887_29170 [Methylobacterium haplocladii]|uniref:Type II secretion system protein GspF domain-containing protein n=1 Tax=Methylobacterium haplocladii TaxID=1176176 RepID=A0A512IM49_9HYPH|nr:hypothetical protein MHA02_11810 [Methylobacterium haplocladii]GLS60239.1 hypothetical protein GCM10007887_29170 [Methylobacterium haplocladii]